MESQYRRNRFCTRLVGLCSDDQAPNEVGMYYHGPMRYHRYAPLPQSVPWIGFVRFAMRESLGWQ